MVPSKTIKEAIEFWGDLYRTHVEQIYTFDAYWEPWYGEESGKLMFMMPRVYIKNKTY